MNKNELEQIEKDARMTLIEHNNERHLVWEAHLSQHIIDLIELVRTQDQKLLDYEQGLTQVLDVGRERLVGIEQAIKALENLKEGYQK